MKKVGMVLQSHLQCVGLHRTQCNDRKPSCRRFERSKIPTTNARSRSPSGRASTSRSLVEEIVTTLLHILHSSPKGGFAAAHSLLLRVAR
jgi:hypothetical protein